METGCWPLCAEDLSFRILKLEGLAGLRSCRYSAANQHWQWVSIQMLDVPILLHFGFFSKVKKILIVWALVEGLYRKKMFCLQTAQLMFLLIVNILLISARFPLESLDRSFPQKACCQKILARIRLVAKTKATAVPRTCSRSAS